MFLCNAFRSKVCLSREKAPSSNMTVYMLSLSVVQVLGKYIFLVKISLANF